MSAVSGLLSSKPFPRCSLAWDRYRTGAVAALFMTVPCTVPALTLTTIWKVAVSPLAVDALEKTTFPVPPTAGVVVPKRFRWSPRQIQTLCYGGPHPSPSY